METTTGVASAVMHVEAPEQFIALFGIREENMALFRRNWAWTFTPMGAR